MQNRKISFVDLEKWITFDQFPEAFPNFTRNQIEWLYRNRKSNGFDKAFQKIGSRKYVHAGIFAECLQEKIST